MHNNNNKQTVRMFVLEKSSSNVMKTADEKAKYVDMYIKLVKL